MRQNGGSSGTAVEEANLVSTSHLCGGQLPRRADESSVSPRSRQASCLLPRPLPGRHLSGRTTDRHLSREVMSRGSDEVSRGERAFPRRISSPTGRTKSTIVVVLFRLHGSHQFVRRDALGWSLCPLEGCRASTLQSVRARWKGTSPKTDVLMGSPTSTRSDAISTAIMSRTSV